MITRIGYTKGGRRLIFKRGFYNFQKGLHKSFNPRKASIQGRLYLRVYSYISNVYKIFKFSLWNLLQVFMEL